MNQFDKDLEEDMKDPEFRAAFAVTYSVARIMGVIASFPWDNFGLNEVQETIRSASTEWIQALAESIVAETERCEACECAPIGMHTHSPAGGH